jgi:hypothetical protein
MSDFEKIIITIVGYLIVGPALGILMVRRPALQRFVFGLIIITGSFKEDKRSFFVNSIEYYRGHTKGFEFNIMDIFAIAVLAALYFDNWKRFRLTPPGVMLWLLFCALCCISYINAASDLYATMALVKWLKAIIIFVAAYNFLRDRKDLDAILTACSIALILQALVCLYLRYRVGVFQVPGWFGHQNSMAIWAYGLGLPVFAAALSKDVKLWRSIFYLCAFAGAALCIILSVSRGALGIFAMASALLMAGSLLRGFSAKRTTILALAVIGGSLLAWKSWDTLADRFNTAGGDTEATNLRWILERMSEAMLDDTKIGVGWNNYNIVNSRPHEKYSRILERWDEAKGGGPEDAKLGYKANPCTENYYWVILAENGYPGIIGFILFAGVTAFWCLRNIWWNRDNAYGFMLWGIAVMLAATYAHCKLERVLTQTPNFYAWMLFLGIVARIESWRRILKKRGYFREEGILTKILNGLAYQQNGSRVRT